jgi:hypothetical protein
MDRLRELEARNQQLVRENSQLRNELHYFKTQEKGNLRFREEMQCVVKRIQISQGILNQEHLRATTEYWSLGGDQRGWI